MDDAIANIGSGKTIYTKSMNISVSGSTLGISSDNYIVFWMFDSDAYNKPMNAPSFLIYEGEWHANGSIWAGRNVIILYIDR